MTNLVTVHKELDEDDIELIQDMLYFLSKIGSDTTKSIETRNLEAWGVINSLSDVPIRNAMRDYWEKHKVDLE
jgi:hypothetical protein